MNIAIIGRTEMLFATADHLIDKGHNIKLIITAKESPEYKKTFTDFKKLADKIDAKYLCTSKINSEENVNLIERISDLDIGISVNYPNIISQKVIDIFPFGILNAHAGDLPRYRGNACPSWAIINGEKRIGLCIHRMIGAELDSGDIIARDYLNIDDDTKIGDVYKWLTYKIPVLFSESIEKLSQDKSYKLAEQSRNPEKILRCYPRMPEDGRINWSKSNLEILRIINSSSEPFGGAFCFYKGKKLSIWDANIYEDHERYCAVPGQVTYVDKDKGFIVVATGKGKLKINEISYTNIRGKPSAIVKSIRNRLK